MDEPVPVPPPQEAARALEADPHISVTRYYRSPAASRSRSNTGPPAVNVQPVVLPLMDEQGRLSPDRCDSFSSFEAALSQSTRLAVSVLMAQRLSMEEPESFEPCNTPSQAGSARDSDVLPAPANYDADRIPRMSDLQAGPQYFLQDGQVAVRVTSTLIHSNSNPALRSDVSGKLSVKANDRPAPMIKSASAIDARRNILKMPQRTSADMPLVKQVSVQSIPPELDQIVFRPSSSASNQSSNLDAHRPRSRCINNDFVGFSGCQRSYSGSNESLTHSVPASPGAALFGRMRSDTTHSDIPDSMTPGSLARKRNISAPVPYSVKHLAVNAPTPSSPRQLLPSQLKRQSSTHSNASVTDL